MKHEKVKEKREKPKYNSFQNSAYILKEMWLNDKRLLFIAFVSMVCGVLTPYLTAYLPKVVIGELMDKVELSRFFLSVGGFVLLLGLVAFFRGSSDGSFWSRTGAVRHRYVLKLFDKNLTCDYPYVESAEHQALFARANAAVSSDPYFGLNRMLPAICRTFTTLAGFILYTSVLAQLNFIIVLLLIVSSAVYLLVLSAAQRFDRKIRAPRARVQRKIPYITNRLDDVSYGKDIRIFSMQGMLKKIRDGIVKENYSFDKRIQRMWTLPDGTQIVTGVLRDLLAYLFLVHQVAAGVIAVPDFLFYVGLIAGFSSWVNELVNGIAAVSYSNFMICDVRQYLELSGEEEPADVNPLPVFPITIEFRDVSFAYTQNGDEVLNHISFTINAGENIALVGVNGGGKTTIIKLLTGLYRPDSGEILLNGIDSRKYTRKQLTELFGTVFQEIFILPFTLIENVSMKPADQTDRNRAVYCLKKAGLWDAVDELPKNVDSYMTKLAHEDGVIFSGGQQQKLLLARALYKDAPILILDEPTAALDPISESEVYENYGELSGGKTSLFVSHRLASTRFCDRILLLDGGRIAESGTHGDLMTLHGKYAEMFEIQSQYYKTETEKVEVQEGVSVSE
ncbi:MAG: ABC transporter ATP-binding protein/permease [Oscillospiraceae bacterium]|nr:ABC transporter ATP-binding protein/permease [Oscillospiraceae bacterium]